MPSIDVNRVYDGLKELSGGQDDGKSSTLIALNQVAAASNLTFRGSYAKTRPPYFNHYLRFDNPVTQSHWKGKFQGAAWYDAEVGESGIVVSRDGRLFRIQIGYQNIVSEITPIVAELVTSDFTVPAIGSSINVPVSSEQSFSSGQNIFIDSGSYTVQNLFSDEIQLLYNGGGVNSLVVSGTTILDANQSVITTYAVNPSDYDFIHLFQAENYMIVLAGQHKTVIYDGTNARQSAIGELPPAYIGVYGWGRIWLTLPNQRAFIAGDLVYGPSGTPENGYRDAILKVTENDLLNGGGYFGVPANAGPITAMQFLAQQDTSVGLGPLLVGTTNMVFSVRAPVDRTVWQNLTFPIQTISILDYGPRGPRSTNSVNGDLWYRAEDGVRSFRAAQRYIDMWGNTPMSREVSGVISYDTSDLLFYGSSTYFDNKYIQTVSPLRTDSIGIAHRGFTCINFDLISDMRQKTQPCWEGVLSGIKPLQILKGRLNNISSERCFILATSKNEQDIELWELLKDGQGYYDIFSTLSNNQITLNRTPIESFMETRSMDSQLPFQKKSLHMGELFLDELIDDVEIKIQFRPDQYPNWTDWSTIPICSKVTQCEIPQPVNNVCTMFNPNSPQYAARITLPQPSEICNEITKSPMREGFEFQFRIEITGHCRIRGFRVHAKLRQQSMEGECPPATCSNNTVINKCPGVSWFIYDSQADYSPACTPTTPVNFTAENVSETDIRISVSWQESQGSGVTYTLYRSTMSGFLPDDSNKISDLIVGLNYVDTGLLVGTEYFYKIIAANQCGNSAPSSEASASTPAASPFPSDDIWAYYRFDNDLSDATGNGRNLSNGGTGVSYAIAKINDGSLFDSSSPSSIWLKGVTGFDPRNDFTISAWISSSAAQGSIFCQGWSEFVIPAFAPSFNIWCDGMKIVVRYSPDFGSGSQQDIIANWILSSTLDYLTVTKSGSVIKIYINTTLITTENLTAIIPDPTGEPFVIGGEDESSINWDGYRNSFDGILDEFGIWTRALTEIEISSLYNFGEGLPYE